MKITTTEIIADEGKYIHRIHQNIHCFFRRCGLMLNETIDDFEEMSASAKEQWEREHQPKEAEL